MPLPLDGQKGTYAVILELTSERSLQVGRLGTCSFPPGFYLYAGSARGGLGPRLRRHLRRKKPLRWHVDYLRQEARVREVWWSESDSVSECHWYRAAFHLPGAREVVKGFGSSDCRCSSHLVHLPAPPSFQRLRRKLPKGPIHRASIRERGTASGSQ